MFGRLILEGSLEVHMKVFQQFLSILCDSTGDLPSTVALYQLTFLLKDG